MEYGNEKLKKLVECLDEQFRKQEGSKVIIFVKMRHVAQYLAEWLCAKSKKYKAKGFTSSGPSCAEGGEIPLSTLKHLVCEIWAINRCN